MGSKVQGEGDYESARHYNDETRKFVEEHTKGGQELKGSADEASDKLTPEEKEALAEGIFRRLAIFTAEALSRRPK